MAVTPPVKPAWPVRAVLMSLFSSVANDAAVVYVPVTIVTVTDRLAAAPESTTIVNVTVAVFPNVRPAATPPCRVEIRALWAPKLPFNRRALPNEVVFATRSISSRSCTISFWAA